MTEEPQVPVDVFHFDDYRTYLNELFKGILGRKHLSYRQLAKKCGFSSPNYLQKIVAGQRSLTRDSCKKLARGLDLDEQQTRYLAALVEHSRAPAEEKSDIEAEMQRMQSQHESNVVADDSIYSNWLFGVVWEMSLLEDFQADTDWIRRRLGNLPTGEEVDQALEFLKTNMYIVYSDETKRYEQRPLRFAPVNDKRQFEIRRNHERFLDIARHRLSDPVKEREFQGLTLAIPRSRFDELRKRMRGFVQEINEEFSHLTDSEVVIRLQCSAYKLTVD